MELSSVQLAASAAMRVPGSEPTLADFERALAYAERGAIVSCTG
jgi:hypothetical protein